MSEAFNIESIRRLDVRPGETLVVTVRDPVSREEFERLVSDIRPKFPDGIKVLFVTANVELGVVSADTST